MDYSAILFEIKDAVARITLNRPDRLNAFTEQMHKELAAALDQIRNDPSVRVLVITGAGRAFSAGQDLGERMMSGEPDAAPRQVGSSLEKYYNPLVRSLRELPLPVLCVVNGVAAGAACNIALACDLVLAARSAAFVQVFSNIGLIPDAGGTYLLPRLVGMARAMAWSLLAEKVSAEQAVETGLIWRCVDDELLGQEAESLVQRLAAGPTHAYALTKRALHASPGHSLEEQLAMEAHLQSSAIGSKDFREGVAAFLGKRRPAFRGE